MKPLGIEFGVEWFDAKLLEQGMLFDRSISIVVPQHRSEPSGVVQPEGDVVELPFHVVMIAQQRTWRNAAQRARHSQVYQLGTLIEVDQQILTPSTASSYHLSVDPVGKVGRNRPAHTEFMDYHSF